VRNKTRRVERESSKQRSSSVNVSSSNKTLRLRLPARLRLNQPRLSEVESGRSS